MATLAGKWQQSLLSLFSRRVASSESTGTSSDTDVPGHARLSTSEKPQPYPEMPAWQILRGLVERFSAGLRQTRKWQYSVIAVWKLSRKMDSSWGSRNYQYSALTVDAKSVSHKAAVVTTSKQTSMVPYSKSACASEEKCPQAQLWTVLCMVENKRSLRMILGRFLNFRK